MIPSWRIRTPLVWVKQQLTTKQKNNNLCSDFSLMFALCIINYWIHLHFRVWKLKEVGDEGFNQTSVCLQGWGTPPRAVTHC